MKRLMEGDGANRDEVARQLLHARLYGILDLGYVASGDLERMARGMLEGGVDILQLRAKGAAPEEVALLAGSLAPLARRHGVPFIINDHPGQVAVAGADGCHVGQDDHPVARAREMAASPGRPAPLVGKSTHSLDQALRAVGEGADYIGFGPLFATPTKPDYRPVGLGGVAEVQRAVSVPVFCIGGVKLENLPEILDAGATRVVIVSGILCASDVAGYCTHVQELLRSVPG